MSAPADWRSRKALLSATAAFHLNNWSRQGHRVRQPIELDLKIGLDKRRVTVRPFSGDIFILHEVLAFESYKVSENSIDPLSVKTIVDCGAKIGITALYMASRYPNARIICIEPDPKNFELLQLNIENEDRISAVQAALVGINEGPVYLTQDRPAWGNGVADGPGDGTSIEVAAITMDELAAQFEIDTIDILKVDIEGAEEDVFARPGFMSKVRFIAIELHNAYTLDRFQKDIAPMGFNANPPGAFGGVRAVTAVPNN